MKKMTILALVTACTAGAWAEAATPTAKPAYAKGRQASISLWGGYTPYVGAVDQNSYKSACEVYTNAGGSCTNKLGGLAGGIDLWMGNVAQLGFAAQYFQAGSLDGNSSTTTNGVLPGSTITTKTVEKLNSQFIPLLAQFRIHPKFFYIGIGAGVAINITNYEFSINGNSVSGRQVSNPTGFFAQATLGTALPISDDVTVDVFVKGSLLTVFYSTSKDSSGYNTYSAASAWAVTPGLAVSFHF